MRYIPTDPPRTFEAGYEYKRTISDCGKIHLEADELVTFVTKNGGEYDVTRKSWGFYATPSTNARLVSFGLHACIARNREGRLFILLVEKGKEDDFDTYMTQERMSIVHWLDTL